MKILCLKDETRKRLWLEVIQTGINVNIGQRIEKRFCGEKKKRKMVHIEREKESVSEGSKEERKEKEIPVLINRNGRVLTVTVREENWTTRVACLN